LPGHWLPAAACHWQKSAQPAVAPKGKTQMNNDPYEAFKAELHANIRRTITLQRAKGVLAMSKEKLVKVTPIPKDSIGPVGKNAPWIYRQMFDDAIAALPPDYRSFVQR
jgi:hypothetical protein